ncbi:hypothetical protein BDK51DRAFT_49209 [Blyttiomyces helicus]|uniref:Uncharacterized protein n=1 Tax=Blyttiomyces helicus TaxID=388810 RepID=A0A4P9VUS0_9FUNG|nr:hypothetical protein BDK51DRAFT_49209 [Blyttiomyces helicus]|eukprot:RKO83351.1 hypothetical protein BDK51DRAFT_49209 [Blyttiomyces helicus]
MEGGCWRVFLGGSLRKLFEEAIGGGDEDGDDGNLTLYPSEEFPTPGLREGAISGTPGGCPIYTPICLAFPADWEGLKGPCGLLATSVDESLNIPDNKDIENYLHVRMALLVNEQVSELGEGLAEPSSQMTILGGFPH